jgi:RHS repeat-associated protein
MYDDVGNRTIMSVTDSGGTRNHVYSYDNIYQLTDVNYPVGYDYLATDTTFNYDATGNRTSVIDGGGSTTYVTNALNQYTSVANVQYLYDKAGNTTYDGGSNMYGYDAENRLMTVTRSPNALSAACDTGLTLTTGGTGSWSAETSVYCPDSDNDAVQSPDISDSQSTWIDTSVQGAGTLKFWWKVSSQTGDSMVFVLDGQVQASQSGSGGWGQHTYTVSGSGTHTFRWRYNKDASGSGGSDCMWLDHIEWTSTATNFLALAVDSPLTYTTGGNKIWYGQTSTYYYGGDAAQSGDDVNDSQESWMQTTVDVQTQGSLTFYWKVSSQSNSDWLEFYIDAVRQDRISGTVDWQQKSYTITAAGSHTLKWRYVRDGSGSAGSNCGWVDAVQWISPEQPPSVISYTYDPSGRRIEKKYDGLTQMKYVYDGDHIIAEYDGFTNLLHKYIYGPGVDQPICMIDVPNSNATYYYHFDGLGSVIALTNSAGSVANLYEYSVYGEVSASDASHPNRFLFTAREFDKDTGLYYYRARYYNPYIGRFLQTDPIGYVDGMNAYWYCGNNPSGLVDPLGLKRKVNVAFYDSSNPNYKEAANDFRWSFDMKGVTDPLPFIEACLNSIRRDADIDNVYFYDDSHLNKEQDTLVSIEFGDAVFDAECHLGSTSGEQPHIENPVTAAFFRGLGDVLRRRNGTLGKPQDPAEAATDGAIIHLRQDYAANFHGGDPCPNLFLYSGATGHRMTAVDGALDFSWVDSAGEHEEAREFPGADYTTTSSAAGPHPYSGDIYMTRSEVWPSGRHWMIAYPPYFLKPIEGDPSDPDYPRPY